MKKIEIDVIMGGRRVKTFIIHDYVEGKWKWTCRTVGANDTSGYIQSGTILIQDIGKEQRIGSFSVSIHQMKDKDEFKIFFITSKPGEPETFLTLDCKCTKIEETAPQTASPKNAPKTKTLEEIKWEKDQIKQFPLR